MAHDASDKELLRLLPPLPTPDRAAQRGESVMGTLGVLVIVLFCVAGTYGGCHIMEFEGPRYWPSAPTTLLTLVYAEAALAFACLVGLLCADPGEVRRSEATCLPMPEEISLALRAGVPPASTVNIESGERTYCVRCFVWRTPEPPVPLASSSPLRRGLVRCCMALACDRGGIRRLQQDGWVWRSNGIGFSLGGPRFHHCSTCQRCVANFDHHCSFFGRCIAGQGLRGNMGFFRAILCTGSLGAFTAGASLVVGLLSTEGYTFVLGVGLAIYLGFTAVFLLCSAVFMFVMHLLPSHSSAYTSVATTTASEVEAETIGAAR